jgi:hypothetical protein
VPGKYVAGARKVCRGRHGARGRRVGQACLTGYLVEGLELLIRNVAYTKYDATGLVRWPNIVNAVITSNFVTH